MYISRLYLRAFGKFVHKRIYFGKKLNIVYGENETGKSTIHNFIEAMLYGFGDDKNSHDLCEKYRPWESKLYKGSITLDDVQKRKYLITRDFIYGITRISDKDSEKEDENENENAEEDVDIAYPGEHFFKMNKTAFENTVSIRQLGNKTDRELSTEVKNKIVNLSKSKDESISIDSIVGRLNHIKEEAGSESDPKTLLGQYAIRLNELQKSRENTVKANRQTIFLAMEKKKLNSKIDEIDEEIVKLNKEIVMYELYVEKTKYLKAEPINDELIEINSKLLNMNDIREDVSRKDYEDAARVSSILNKMHSDADKLREEKNEAESKLEMLRNDISNGIADDFDMNRMNSDFKEYEENKIKIRGIEEGIKAGIDSIKQYDFDEINGFVKKFEDIERNNNKIEVVKILVNDRSNDEMSKFAKNQNLKKFLFAAIGTIFVLGAVALAYAAYYFGMAKYYVGIGISVFGIISYIMASIAGRKVYNARKEIESVECRRADNEKIINTLNEDNAIILKETGCQNIEDLSQIHDKKKSIKILIEQKNILLGHSRANLENMIQINIKSEKKLQSAFLMFEIAEINQDNMDRANEIFNRKDSVKEDIVSLEMLMGSLNQRLSTSDKEISFEEKRLQMILNANNMNSTDEFKEIIDKNDMYAKLKEQKENCEKLLQSVLQGDELEGLRTRIQKTMHLESKEIDKNEHMIRIFKKNEEKNRLYGMVKDTNIEIDEIEKNARKLVEIEEEIEFYQDKMNSFNERIQAADIAISKIIEISDCIKGDFMPILRKSISENFAYVTDGRYKEVMVDENMNILVSNTDTQTGDIDISKLSGGTLDQLYLSLRIGLGSVLSGNRYIPLILDDSFVQYDANRLKKSMEMLARESERRQIIIFTCQERELEIAKQLDLKFNLIKL